LKASTAAFWFPRLEIDVHEGVELSQEYLNVVCPDPCTHHGDSLAVENADVGYEFTLVHLELDIVEELAHAIDPVRVAHCDDRIGDMARKKTEMVDTPVFVQDEVCFRYPGHIYAFTFSAG